MRYCSKCGKEVPEAAAFCPSCGAALQGAGAPSQPPTAVGAKSGFDILTKDRQAQEYWFKRLIAFVIDFVIIYAIIGIVIAVVTIPALIASQLALPVFGLGLGFISGVSGILLVIYFAFAEAIYGASVGKAIMGLRVTGEDGKNLGLVTSFIRNISKIYWVLLLLDVIVGLALEVDYKRKFTDRFVRTSVSLK